MPDQKRTIVVHAGRHKTGTSAIQHFLFANRDALASAGYYYPKSGFIRSEPAHHGVALALIPRKRAFSPEAGHKILRNFSREISASEGTVIVSSEQFQNVAPHRLARLLPNWNVRAVIYLRDHLHYLVSSYQQLVHARTVSLSIDDYRERSFRVVYADMLDHWADSFGAENLTVCIYDKASIRNGNVVEDFIWRLTGREASSFGIINERDINPSLGEPLLEFKRRINAHLTDEREQQRALYGSLSRLAARDAAWREKPVLTAEFVEKVKNTAAPDTQRLVQHYLGGGRSPFSYTWSRTGPAMDWTCDAGAIMDELQAVSPKAAGYIRDKVPAELWAPVNSQTELR